MEEAGRVVRCHSEDTERPYFQIRYRLSLTGKELLSEALNGGPGGLGLGLPGRDSRSSSVFTTVSSAQDLGDLRMASVAEADFDMSRIEGADADFGDGTRGVRSQSLGAPGPHAGVDDVPDFYANAPGTPRTSHQRSAQRKRFEPTGGGGGGGGGGMEIDSEDHHRDRDLDLDHEDDDEGSPRYNLPEMKRSMSAGTDADFYLHRGAPAIPKQDLYGDGKRDAGPHCAAEFAGLVTCLNSKNVHKYRLGQQYRKGTIVGIDDKQGKIVVFQKNMPAGTLVVMRTGNVDRYEKGYSVQGANGSEIGTVHAVDRRQRLLVVNTVAAPGNGYAL